MPEYIEREALKKVIGDLHFQNYGVALLAIMEIPTSDVVEVVRCKDCVYCDSGECVYHSEPTEQREYERWTVDVNDNDFCSYGERKGD